MPANIASVDYMMNLQKRKEGIEGDLCTLKTTKLPFYTIILSIFNIGSLNTFKMFT